MAQECGARLIHMSTDCIFSGKQGNYREDDFSDAEDLYGRTKFLGELHGQHCVTIRSSIMGLELVRKQSLVEWFLAQTGTIKGYTKAIYTGLTTQEMSRVIHRILTQQTALYGLWQVASQPISKFALLTLLNKKLERNNMILPDESFCCDRSLNGERFAATTGYQVPDWELMISELSEQIVKREEVLA